MVLVGVGSKGRPLKDRPLTSRYEPSFAAEGPVIAVIDGVGDGDPQSLHPAAALPCQPWPAWAWVPSFHALTLEAFNPA